MTLKECYTALGGNYDDVTARLRNEKIVQKFVIKFLSDTNYDLLCSSLEKGDYEEAFRAAHTIKGMCQNLSFDTLLNSSDKMTEALRTGNKPETAEIMKQVTKDYQQTVSAIKAFQEGIQ